MPQIPDRPIGKPTDPFLTDLLRQLPVSPAERAAFAHSDAEATVTKVRLLTAAGHYFNAHARLEYGGRPGPARDRGLVEQVIAAAFQTYAGEDPHPTLFDKAAMLLRGITQGHPFAAANKRTGFLVAAYFLEAVGEELPADLPVVDMVDLCVRVSAGQMRDVYAIATTLRVCGTGLFAEAGRGRFTAPASCAILTVPT